MSWSTARTARSFSVKAEHDRFERFAARATLDSVTLLVSHRFSTVRQADLIVVLERGRVIESGSHAELLALGGTYAELLTLQAEIASRGVV